MRFLLSLVFLLIIPHIYAEHRDVKLAALPALSPDGSQLVFSWHGDLWKVSAKGGEAIRLTSHPADDSSPVISPDGKTVAFTSNREGNRQAYVVNIDGGVPKRIGYHSEGYVIIDWYSDGRALLVSSLRDHHGRRGGRFYKLSVERNAEVEIFNAGVNEGSLSVDDKNILFTREGSRLYRKGYKGSQSSQIWSYNGEDGDFQALLKGEHAYRTPMVSADQKSFYFVSNESGAFNLWKYTYDGAVKKQLTKYEDDGIILPSISRDGNFIVYRQLFDLFIMSTVDLKPRKINITVNSDIDFVKSRNQVSKTSNDIDFSSDGLEMAFVSGHDLWVMDTVLKEPVQVTKTNELERDVIFSKDNSALYCIKDDGLKTSIVKVEKENKKYWWQSNKFSETVLIESSEQQSSLSLSPDGKSLAFVRGNGKLMIYNLKSKKEKKFLESWDFPSYTWSPDSKWIAYAIEDNNYNNDVWLAPLDASRKPYNVSLHPDYDGYPSFSPDGKMLVFTSSRFESKSDICYVYLTKEKAEDSSRDRTLVKALAAMKKRSKPVVKKAPVKKAVDGKPSEPKAVAKAGQPQVKKKKKPKEKLMKIDFDGLNERVRFIKGDGAEYGYFWSPDSKSLGFLVKNGLKIASMKVQFPDNLKPSLLFAGDFRPIRWLKTGAILCSYKGVPSSLSKGKMTQHAFSVSTKENLKEMNRLVFRHIWRKMRDRYYDEKLNNRDWSAIRQKYEKIADDAPDSTVFDRNIAMLLGELNGSHLGYRSNVRRVNYSSGTEVTAHLGVRFDSKYKGLGLKIAKVIKGSQASFKKSLLKLGDVILSIDGKKCSLKDDLTLLLNGSLKRDIKLSVIDKDEKKREVIIRPHSYSSIRSLLYDEWLDDNREKAHKKSLEKIGYLHVSKMQWAEFNKFREEVFKEGHNRDGLIIDVRDNGGGFTTDHLLTVLCQPRHAVCVPRDGGRGYPFSRQVYSNWHKPIVVLCNQNSFSNAEIFSHSIKNLARGKLVGVPTAGGVISTGAANILGKGTLRIPFRGWFVLKTGEDMELHGAVPDIVLWSEPGEVAKGKDRQLEKAVEVLLKDIEAVKKKGTVKLRKASER